MPPKDTPITARHLCTPKASKSAATSPAGRSKLTASSEADSYPRVLYLRNRKLGKARMNCATVASQMWRSVNKELEKNDPGRMWILASINPPQACTRCRSAPMIKAVQRYRSLIVLCFEGMGKIEDLVLFIFYDFIHDL